MITVELLENALDAQAAHADFLTAHGHLGAVATFTGVVRGEGASVDHLWLDWYPGMTEASILDIAQAAEARFATTAVCIKHRVGRVSVGDAIVFVAAASGHRRAALDAVDYLMDRLKSEAALWKREGGPGGERWIEPTGGDADSLARW